MTAAVTIRTDFTPAITFDPTRKSEAKGVTAWILRLVRPAVDVQLPVLGDFHAAPYGQPAGAGGAVLVLIAVLALIGAYTFVARIRQVLS